MKSSFVGRGLAYAVILAVIAWTAVRALGARPPETPNPGARRRCAIGFRQVP